MSGWLSALFGRFASRGTDIPLGYGVNYVAPLKGVLNSVTKYLDVELEDGALAPAKLAPVAEGIGIPFVIGPVRFLAGVPGTADDTTVLESVPFDFIILDVMVRIETAIDPSTGRLRNAVGGGGSALSTLFDTIDTGVLRDNFASAPITVNEGDSLYWRRSDRGVQGSVWVSGVRT